MFSHIRVATLVAIHALLILVLVACGGAGPAGTTARVDAYVTYAGDFHIYEVLKDSDPGLWELTSPHALIGRNPSLPINIVRGEGDAATLLDRAVELHRALVDAGYDATLTMLGTAGTTIPWSGPDREALIQVILEAAGR
jgi:hypothetical protein